MTTFKSRVPRGTVFPIVEAFGYPHNSASPAAQVVQAAEQCPFSGERCEKNIQYKMGYCSVTYAAKWDHGTPHTYAVCDHRLDGPPIEWAVEDHFDSENAILVPEVTATSAPKLNVDFVAFRDDPSAEEGVDLIAIEAQAIDLRGGSVGPAWRAWKENNAEQWRAYFTEEARRKDRRDAIDYGVNTGNVYKRLGTQITVKGEFFKQVHVPFYVVTQHRILQQLRERVNFEPVAEGEQWDITFVSFDYDGTHEPDGRLAFRFVEAVRTTLASYIQAMTTATGFLRSDFINRVRLKATT